MIYGTDQGHDEHHFYFLQFGNSILLGPRFWMRSVFLGPRGWSPPSQYLIQTNIKLFVIFLGQRTKRGMWCGKPDENRHQANSTVGTTRSHSWTKSPITLRQVLFAQQFQEIKHEFHCNQYVCPKKLKEMIESRKIQFSKTIFFRKQEQNITRNPKRVSGN